MYLAELAQEEARMTRESSDCGSADVLGVPSPLHSPTQVLYGSLKGLIWGSVVT